MPESLINQVSAKEALDVVVEAFGINKTAHKLGYTVAYIYLVYHGDMPVTQNMLRRIAKLKRKPVYLVAVYMKTEADKIQAQKVPMEERRRRLLK